MTVTDSQCEQKSETVDGNHVQFCSIVGCGDFSLKAFSCSLMEQWWVQKHFKLSTYFRIPQPSYTTHSSHPYCQLHLYILLPKSLLYLIPHGNHYRQCLCKSPWWQAILWSPRWHLQTLITSQIHFVCLFEMSTDLIYQPKPCVTTQIYIFPGIKRETGERKKWNSI